MAEHSAEAHRIVDHYWKWGAAAGLIPFPIVDVAAVAAVQIRMIERLAHLYGVPFKHDAVKSIVAALVGATTPRLFVLGAAGIAGPAMKFVPGLGTVAGVVATPAFNAATTLALGRVFIQHFESGGTFLTMHPEKAREHYRRELQSASKA